MKKITLSYSVLNEYKKCPHSFKRRYLDSLVRKPYEGTPSYGSPLEFGHLFHMFLEHWLTGKTDVEETLKIVWEEAVANTRIPEVDGKRGWRHLQNICYLAADFFTNHSEHKFKVVELEPEVEWEFGKLQGYQVMWRSHFDGVGKLDDGRTVILEHKTTSFLNKMEDLALSSAQAASYAYAMKHHTKYDFDGVLYNCFNSYDYKKPPKDITLAAKQLLLNVSDERLNIWYKETEYWINRLLTDLKNDTMVRIGGPDACTMYGRCPFFSECHEIDESNVKDYLAENFIEEPWKGFKLDE